MIRKCGAQVQELPTSRCKEVYLDQNMITADFFWTKFFENPSGHGPTKMVVNQKCVFLAAPCSGEKLFEPWASGRAGQERPQENLDQKVYVYVACLP